MAVVDPARSAAVLDSLRAAYAEEVARRLPLLRAAIADDSDGSLDVIRHHAHTFASSAVVVGELGTAQAAAECERLVLADVDATAVRESARRFAALLEPWLHGRPA